MLANIYASMSPKYFNIFTGRIATKWQAASTKFTQRLKISIFALQGRLVTLIHVKFTMSKRHLGPLGRAKFHLSRCTGGGYVPPKFENFWFW